MTSTLQKLAAASLFFMGTLGLVQAQWVSNACPGVTVTATTNSGMSPQPDCASINATLLPGGWDGGSSSGFIRYNWVSPISSVRVEFFSVNTVDYATITTNTGGALTITSVGSCSSVSGTVIGPYLGGGSYGTTAFNVSSTIPFTMLNVSNTGGSSGWVTDCPVNVILATDLDYFRAKWDGEGAVALDWQSSHESNTSHFEVQRSVDAIEWENIGQVTAAGNSDSPIPYHFADQLPLSGKVMYRLKAVDVDGSFTQSAVQTVLVDDYIKVFPTMSATTVRVRGIAEASQLKVFNHQGRQYDVPMNMENEDWKLDISALPSGMYILRLQEQGKMLSRKIWKL